MKVEVLTVKSIMTKNIQFVDLVLHTMKSIMTRNVQLVDLVFWPVWGLGRFTHLERMQDELSIKISDK